MRYYNYLQKFPLLLVLIASACTNPGKPETPLRFNPSFTPSITPPPIVSTKTSIPSPTASATKKPSPTHTQTSTPTSTSILTPFPPTWTSLPTIPPTTAVLFAEDLYKTNYGCKLPCWWGIIPGKTSWREAQQFLRQFAQVEDRDSSEKSFSVGSVLFFISKENMFSSIEDFYIIRNNIVESIETGIPYEDLDEYHLSSFLQTYGPPDEVWLSTYGEVLIGEISSLPFTIGLFYPSQGVLAIFGSAKTYISENKVLGCRNEGVPSRLGLWAPEQKMTFNEAIELFRVQTDGILFLLLEQATDMNTETFYDTFKQSNDAACIKSPTSLWPTK